MKNQFLQFLESRRSIRKFKPEQIKEEDLQALLSAGTYAPTGHGAQSPIIIAVQDKNTIAQLSRMNAAVMGANFDPYYGAPAILLILADRARDVAAYDGCSVTSYLLLAAHALGIGGCWINRSYEMFASEEGKELLKKWGVKGEYIGVGACAIGYADEAPTAAPRKADYIYRV